MTISALSSFEGSALMVNHIAASSFTQNSVHYHLSIQHNGIGIAEYQAVDLYANADSILQISGIDASLKERLNLIIKTVDPEDNPYLLIGKMKK